jgi:hypothetical protein
VKKAIVVFVFLFCSALSWAQTKEDSTQTKTINRDFLLESIDTNHLHSPKKAGKLAVYLPFMGLGQIYNKKYWKLPIVYGVTGLLAYQIVNQSKNYAQYRDELYRRDISAQYPNLNYQGFDEALTKFNTNTIRTRKDIFRKRRDRMILFTGLFYGLTIVDAIVDAHLQGFSISKKGIVSVRPTFVPTSKSATAGLNIRLSF